MGFFDDFLETAVLRRAGVVPIELPPRSLAAIALNATLRVDLAPEYGGTNPHAQVDVRALSVDNRNGSATLKFRVNGSLTYRVPPGAQRPIEPQGARILYYEVTAEGAALGADECEVKELGVRFAP